MNKIFAVIKLIALLMVAFVLMRTNHHLDEKYKSGAAQAPSPEAGSPDAK